MPGALGDTSSFIVLLILHDKLKKPYLRNSHFTEGKSEALRHLLACYDNYIHIHTVYGTAPSQRSCLFSSPWLRLGLLDSL